MKIDNLNIHLSCKSSHEVIFRQHEQNIVNEIEKIISAVAQNMNRSILLSDISIKLPVIKLEKGHSVLSEDMISRIRHSVVSQINQWLATHDEDVGQSGLAVNDITRQQLYDYLHRGVEVILSDSAVVDRLAAWIREHLFEGKQSVQALYWLTDSPRRMSRWLSLLTKLKSADRRYVINRCFTDLVVALVEEYLCDAHQAGPDCPFLALFLLHRKNPFFDRTEYHLPLSHSFVTQQLSHGKTNALSLQIALRLIYKNRHDVTHDVLKQCLSRLPIAIDNEQYRYLENWMSTLR